VSTGVEIRIFDRSANREGVTTVPKLPVRIGRNSLNDLVLAYNFVSQFHATLALHDGKLVLRDLGSTNGVVVGGRRVPANAFVDLTPFQNTFNIVALSLQVTVKHVTRPPSQRLNSTSHVALPGGQYPSQQPPPHPAEAQLRTLYGRYRTAAAELTQAVQWSLSNTPAEQRSAFLQRVQQEFPSLAMDPEFRGAMHIQGGSNPPQGPELARAQLENLALNGVQEIARSLLPGLGAPDDLAGLATLLDKLKSTLDVFLSSFVQLRDGYRQFEEDMALRKRASTSGQSRGTSADVAGVLLDWRNPNQDAISAVSATFADFMIHQVALLNGVMNGVKSLMHELSPDELEALAKADGGLGMGPLRYRSLWRAYEKRYKDVTEEDKHLFDLVFGATFASGYERSIENR
jgi:type VI secretion system protein ImpI